MTSCLMKVTQKCTRRRNITVTCTSEICQRVHLVTRKKKKHANRNSFCSVNTMCYFADTQKDTLSLHSYAKVVAPV